MYIYMYIYVYIYIYGFAKYSSFSPPVITGQSDNLAAIC